MTGDLAVRIWDPKNRPGSSELLCRNCSSSVAAIAPDGRLVVADNSIHIRDLKNPDSPEVVLRGDSKPVNALAFAPAGGSPRQ